MGIQDASGMSLSPSRGKQTSVAALSILNKRKLSIAQGNKKHLIEIKAKGKEGEGGANQEMTFLLHL